jgi:hypothetical protein
MGIYSSDELKRIASQRRTLFEKAVTDARSITQTSFDIFLSHSFLDKQEVQGLYQELTGFGYSVYVDWIIDPHLDRMNVTKASATLVRFRMKCSKSLLMAVSINAAISKWMPWELGYVDGDTNRCAIIPVSREKTLPKSFKGAEYLQLYPFIKKLPTKGGTDALWVIESEYKYSIFETWFSNGILQENRDINIFNL